MDESPIPEIRPDGCLPDSPPSSFSSNLLLPDAQSNRFSSPHEAFLYVLPYLRCGELLAVQRVCKTLKKGVEEDVLAWQNLKVEPPLSMKLTDELLVRITRKAEGRLKSLTLVDCVKITDFGLQRVVESNPEIMEVALPGCINLTLEGIIESVKGLPNLKRLRLHGLLNITEDHLKVLQSLLHADHPNPSIYYNSFQTPPSGIDSCPIDVEICPKCKEARLVFDCRSETCQEKMWPCRGCYWCVPRCEGCGKCVDSDEMMGEMVCTHVLCSECWLRRPKCETCNRPSCGGHGYIDESLGFICQDCCFRDERRSEY